MYGCLADDRKVRVVKLGTRGLALIKSYEQLRLTAYLPTPNDVWTIGYGHTLGVRQSDVCTIAQADNWLVEDTSRAVDLINTLPLSIALTQSMFDALVSLVFNVGSGAVRLGSTIGSALREGNYYGAWAGFALWKMQSGKPLLGLARRRAREMVLFLEDGMPD